MECPSCNAELPSKECPECGENVPVFGKFCCYCGAALPAPAAAEPEEGGIDFSSRTLCSDGNCIGVINKDGVCNECGKPYSGEAG